MNYLLTAGMTFIFFILIQIPSLKAEVTRISPIALIVISFPHFVLTYWLWHERARDLKKEWWPLIFPFIYMAIFLGAFKYPYGIFSASNIVRISYCYLMYHFAQQLFGVTMWVRGRKGILFSKAEKSLWRVFFLASSFYALLELELRGGTAVLFYHTVKPLSFSPYLVYLSFSALLIFSLALLFIRMRSWFKLKSHQELFPLMFLLVSVIWFVPPFGQEMVFLLPILHAFQYMPFIMMKKKKQSLWMMLGVFLVAMGLGWVLFRLIPFSGPAFLPGALWAPLILTMLNNHHFIIDGRIWKLSDPLNRDLLEEARIDRC